MASDAVDSRGADSTKTGPDSYFHVMPRRFSLVSLVSMSFSLLATWNGVGSAVGISLADASTAGSVWSLLIAATMMTVVALGMAELSSAFPFAGAQYYWCYAVARPDWAPFASYW